jgi:hypothetical protein
LQYYDQAKRLSAGVEDNFSGIDVVYFKSQRALQTLGIPLLLTHIQDHQLVFKSQTINLQQGTAIKELLIGAMDPD